MSPSQPVIVLVHGAWADASSRSSVISELQRRGFTVYAPPNPLRGLPQDSAYLHQFLTENAALQGQPVVLVGHSYGGAVVTNAAVGAPRVKALVYVDAFIPDEGDTMDHVRAAAVHRAAAGLGDGRPPMGGAVAPNHRDGTAAVRFAGKSSHDQGRHLRARRQDKDSGRGPLHRRHEAGTPGLERPRTDAGPRSSPWRPELADARLTSPNRARLTLRDRSCSIVERTLARGVDSQASAASRAAR